jgi:5-methyltetrahydrofolate--homocysteine methyltransferase
LTEARQRRFTPDWASYEPIEPAVDGIHAFTPYPIAELTNYIDWTPFFGAWELKGAYPAILDHPVVGEEARRVFRDAQRLLERIVAEKLLTTRAVVGVFPANSVGDDIEIYSDASRSTVRAVVRALRQQVEKPAGRPSLCLADFVAPKETGLLDHLGAFALTAGIGTDELAAEYEAAHDDYHAIMVKALADRLAEALAERLHERVRTELWRYSPDEQMANDELLREKYVGIRPAPGYPACPDHSEKQTLFDLLDVPTSTAMQLTDSFALQPAASVCGWYFAHPDAFYFGVGSIGRDQAEDYAARKGMTVAEVERWLGPVLAYEPSKEPVP